MPDGLMPSRLPPRREVLSLVFTRLCLFVAIGWWAPDGVARANEQRWQAAAVDGGLPYTPEDLADGKWVRNAGTNAAPENSSLRLCAANSWTTWREASQKPSEALELESFTRRCFDMVERAMLDLGQPSTQHLGVTATCFDVDFKRGESLSNMSGGEVCDVWLVPKFIHQEERVMFAKETSDNEVLRPINIFAILERAKSLNFGSMLGRGSILLKAFTPGTWMLLALTMMMQAACTVFLELASPDPNHTYWSADGDIHWPQARTLALNCLNVTVMNSVFLAFQDSTSHPTRVLTATYSFAMFFLIIGYGANLASMITIDVFEMRLTPPSDLRDSDKRVVAPPEWVAPLEHFYGIHATPLQSYQWMLQGLLQHRYDAAVVPATDLHVVYDSDCPYAFHVSNEDFTIPGADAYVLLNPQTIPNISAVFGPDYRTRLKLAMEMPLRDLPDCRVAVYTSVYMYADDGNALIPESVFAPLFIVWNVVAVAAIITGCRSLFCPVAAGGNPRVLLHFGSAWHSLVSWARVRLSWDSEPAGDRAVEPDFCKYAVSAGWVAVMAALFAWLFLHLDLNTFATARQNCVRDVRVPCLTFYIATRIMYTTTWLAAVATFSLYWFSQAGKHAHRRPTIYLAAINRGCSFFCWFFATLSVPWDMNSMMLGYIPVWTPCMILCAAATHGYAWFLSSWPNNSWDRLNVVVTWLFALTSLAAISPVTRYLFHSFFPLDLRSISRLQLQLPLDTWLPWLAWCSVLLMFTLSASLTARSWWQTRISSGNLATGVDSSPLVDQLERDARHPDGAVLHRQSSSVPPVLRCSSSGRRSSALPDT